MLIAGTDTAVRQSSAAAASPGRGKTLAGIAFFGVVAVATLGWIGFLIWVVLALVGF